MFGSFELLGHISNLMYTIGYAIKDVLWLRVFVMLGCMAEIGYGFKAAEKTLWPLIFWASLGLALNTFQVIFLYRDRHRQVVFTPEELELYSTVFHDFSYADFRKLMNIGRWKELSRGEVLTHEGSEVPDLLLIQKGQALVTIKGKTVATVQPRAFIGEMSFLTGNPASATVRTLEDVRCVGWSKQELRELMSQTPSLYNAMQLVINADLVTKLMVSTNQSGCAEPGDSMISS
jgi:hypothetical protein